MFKDFNQSSDISVQESVVNEVIQITGTFFSGSQGGVNTFYTKHYTNITSGSFVSGGFFQAIYDGSPTSVSSSALMDLTYGHSANSAEYGYSETFLAREKNRIYKEMAGLLLGSVDSTFTFNSTTYDACFFMLFKRRVFKDEIKKGDLALTLQISGTGDGTSLTLSDAGAASSFTVGSSGDEASLFNGNTEVGKVYYDAGIIAFHTGVFVPGANSCYWSGSYDLDRITISGNIDNIVDGLRNRVNQVNLQNQVNLNSTLYFCRALNQEFNYSSNPTFTDSDNRIVVTSGSDNQSRTYITSVGLYDINNNLLAIAKLSEPVKKSPDSEVTIRARLSY
jgi:hypothetical protein